MKTPTVALLRLAYNLLADEVGAAVRTAAPDQRPSHGNVMEQLDFEDGQRLTDLAAGAGMTLQSTGELVDQLEVLGYLERRPDPNDRRAKRIYRTARAMEASRIAADTVERIETDLERLLGPQRLSELRHDLTRVVEARGGTARGLIDS